VVKEKFILQERIRSLSISIGLLTYPRMNRLDKEALKSLRASLRQAKQALKQDQK